jgi:hypothetical protein
MPAWRGCAAAWDNFALFTSERQSASRRSMAGRRPCALSIRLAAKAPKADEREEDEQARQRGSDQRIVHGQIEK